jgi:toxin HigB-1
LRISTFVHKGLKRFYLEGNSKGLPPDAVDKLRKMLSFLQDIADQEELRCIPVWKAHLLSGDRKGVWSLHVTRNRRLTFRIDASEGEVLDVDLEDYH